MPTTRSCVLVSFGSMPSTSAAGINTDPVEGQDFARMLASGAVDAECGETMVLFLIQRQALGEEW